MSNERFELLERRIEAILESANQRFDLLVRDVGLDPETELTFGDWSNLDFCNADLRRFNFTGSNMIGAKFKDALIAGACFHRARYNAKALREAADFDEYVEAKCSSLEQAAYREISSVSDEHAKRLALSRFDAYFNIKEQLRSSYEEQRETAARKLFYESAMIDDLNLPLLSLLINSAFVASTWRSFILLNWSCFRNRSPKPPSRLITRIAALPAEQRLLGLWDLFSQYELKRSGWSKFYSTGQLLAGTVVARNGETGDVVVSCGGQEIEVLAGHLSVEVYNAGDAALGRRVLVAIRKSNMGTMRGAEYVGAILHTIFPNKRDVDNPIEIILGASNSWALLITSHAKKQRLIGGRGIYLDQVRALCGLRRLTVIRRIEEEELAVREFCSSVWKDLVVSKHEGGFRLELSLPSEMSGADPRKYRTFRSMWEKCFPAVDFELFVRKEGDVNWLQFSEPDLGLVV